MMCLLFVFFAAKIHHIYIHWEIVTKYLFPQKCCPSEDKLFIRNAVLSSQMAVFEDKFNPAAPHPDWESNPQGDEDIRLPSNHSRDIHPLTIKNKRMSLQGSVCTLFACKVSRKVFPGRVGCFPTICHQNGQFVGYLMSKSPQFYLFHRFGVLVCHLPYLLSNPLRVRQ